VVSGTGWTAPTQASGGSRYLGAPHVARTVGRPVERWACGRCTPFVCPGVRGVSGRGAGEGLAACAEHEGSDRLDNLMTPRDALTSYNFLCSFKGAYQGDGGKVELPVNGASDEPVKATRLSILYNYIILI
jgi:hypothetical protein